MIWKLLFGLTAAITLFIATQFFIDLNTYFSLSHTAPAKITSWNILELNTDKYALEATYTFKNRQATHRFQKTYFPNPRAAESTLQELKKTPWHAFYNQKNSSLQRLFPFKHAIHLLLSLGVLLYFFWLYSAYKAHNSF